MLARLPHRVLLLPLASGLLLASGCAPAPDAVESPNSLGNLECPAYYLAQDDRCTVLVDFTAHRQTLESLQQGARELRIARQLIAEFQRRGEQRAPGASQIELHAVYIDGTDNYGRPNFAQRTNLVQLTGPAETFHRLTPTDLSGTRQLAQRFSLKTQF